MINTQYSYSLGSARGSRDWYFKGRRILGDEIVRHRMQLTVHIIRQLLKMVPAHRGRRIQEETASYGSISFDQLAINVPLPD